ncbi:putative ATPase [Actinomadura pelletieri DSM 43383]|uniref:Putative ATPase n=1 Tax=Actinomadura pelletieri DSM 43383 TaxID=1120940 RepID=A0A495QQ62_9ACTN|nr:ATP-binding protein [Actinomadura pelletieri]RKS75105.1 putative ATPase [Actinomadura pelletieri DSM 43383]
MITRIEIDGFKSFLDFELDVPPFLALVGPNASGKSNLLDAIEYNRATLRSSSPLLEARRGRPHELFHRVVKGSPVEEFSISVHRLLQLSEGFVGIVRHSGALRVPRVRDKSPRELDLTPRTELPHAVRERAWEGVHEVLNKPDKQPVLALLNEIDNAALNVREYVPEPRVMRGTAPVADTRPLLPDGSNLAAVLGRLSTSDALDDLVVDLASLVPDVTEIKTELNEKRQEWSFDLVVEGQGTVPSTLLSDGTLRVLGLLAALHDPDHSGVLMVEEIENGLHPARLAELLRRIQERVTDLSDPESLDRPLRQVIITSHSPVVVSELYRTRPESLIFMDTAVRVDPESDRVSRVTVAKPVRDEGEPGTFVSPRQVRKYLGTVRQDAP